MPASSSRAPASTAGREGGLDPERLAELRQRIESGFYSSPQAVERIAEGMLEDLLA